MNNVKAARAVAVAKARLRWQKLRDLVDERPDLSIKEAASTIGLSVSAVHNMIHRHTGSYKWPPKS